MGRDHLKGREGGRSNAVLAAAGFSFRRLLRWFEQLLRSWMQMLRCIVQPPQYA